MKQLFKKTVAQYDILRKKNAFIDQYRKEPMFEDGLEEFDDAREVAQELLEEYQACERADYIDYARPKQEGEREKAREGDE